MREKYYRTGMKLIGAMLGMLAAGFLLMSAVYLLPTGRMKGHVANSSELFNYEGIYPQIIQGYKCSQLDNYTDALMYATAIHPGSGNAVRDAMKNARYEYQDEKMVQALNDYANDAAGKEELRYEVAYPRYWHGYLVILKPLLLLFDVSEIRMLSMVAQGGLLLILLYLIRKRLKERYQIPVLMMAAVLNPIVLPLSLQFSWVCYIGLIGAIWLLCREDPFRKKNYLLLFGILGMMTSYMDLLTYPLITLGLPLVLLMLMNREENWKKQVWLVTEVSAIWGIGYAVMWGGKWIFASLFGRMDFMSDVFSEIAFRVSMVGEGEEKLTIGMVWEKQLSVLLNWGYLLIAVLFLGGCAVIYRKNGRMAIKRAQFLNALPYLLVALFPFVWFAALSNHSYEHYWFTYRELAVTVLAGSVAVMELLFPKKEAEENENG